MQIALGVAGTNAAATAATKRELLLTFNSRETAINALAAFLAYSGLEEGSSVSAARERIFGSESLRAAILSPLVGGNGVGEQVLNPTAPGIH